MERQSDIEAKYQKLAAEYSKVRSQATVLKKAVLDEQGKNNELKEAIRNHEQTIRKHGQEMESLTFRNEQLTKRIFVLQQELQACSGKKSKQRNVVENHNVVDVGVLDEEFHKKILENAQLLSSISDKDLEISTYKERLEWLESHIQMLEKSQQEQEQHYITKVQKLQKENDTLQTKLGQRSPSEPSNSTEISELKLEIERLNSELDLLGKKPTSSDELTKYYEKQLEKLQKTKTLALSETRSLLAENHALQKCLENLVEEFSELQTKLDKSSEEMQLTNKSYQSQLDAMTEHLAAQNEKITLQCDEIQMLKHQLNRK